MALKMISFRSGCSEELAVASEFETELADLEEELRNTPLWGPRARRLRNPELSRAVRKAQLGGQNKPVLGNVC